MHAVRHACMDTLNTRTDAVHASTPCMHVCMHAWMPCMHQHLHICDNTLHTCMYPLRTLSPRMLAGCVHAFAAYMETSLARRSMHRARPTCMRPPYLGSPKSASAQLMRRLRMLGGNITWMPASST
eukprot:363560-Chlamydomonas_euryale.AAC.19